MLKQLLIVIFVLQSVAFNALAGTNMSQLNQAEITKMQIMHQVSLNTTEARNTSDAPHSACLTENTSDNSVVDYCSCDHEGSCHSLLCNSIHTSNPIDTNPPHIFSTVALVHSANTTFSAPLLHAYYPPEIPPPLV